MKAIVVCVLVLFSIFYQRNGVDSAPALANLQEPRNFAAALHTLGRLGNLTTAEVEAEGLGGFTCEVCKFIVRQLQKLLATGVMEDVVAGAAKDLCILFEIEDKNVCRQGVDVFKVS